ncbi:MAG: dihydroneopterin triphosphate diphosphatase [Burkholderiales bacterium]|nr:dihydroneopterin triphosphate diphosphatase [Burkholderiales bacterium]PZN02053.1 MAG: dihydroneopterin triphosphate diphosphatase [Pseudomonadota bacterium]
MTGPYKIPRSVLVVIHTPDLQVLLMERVPWPGFWQSVTGSVDYEDEPFYETAVREVAEETGLDATKYELTDWGIENRFEIFKNWRSRYAPGVTHNVEHVFGLMVPEPLPIRCSPTEHYGYIWLPWREAADKCFSWSNRDAILMLPERMAARAKSAS